MNTLRSYISEYIEYCEYRKRLDSKTLKAYKIDLKQFEIFCTDLSDCFAKNVVDDFITNLHKQYKPKTVKRKIASLKAFFHHMEYKELLKENPFTKPNSFQKQFLFIPFKHSFLRFMHKKNWLDQNISFIAALGILLLLNYYLLPECEYLNYVH